MINSNNIEEGRELNFTKWTNGVGNRNGADLTRDLGLNSIMMYGPNTFSKNDEPTITRRNGNIYSRNQTELSNGDIEGANELYPATEITLRIVMERPMNANRNRAAAWEVFTINGLARMKKAADFNQWPFLFLVKLSKA